MLLSFHFVLLPQVLVARVISNENKTKQIKLKTSSGNSGEVWGSPASWFSSAFM